ncbi:MAG: regulatory iron-sulfur-containing complex subunit RicT [bacterium]
MSQEFINVVGIKFRNAGRIYYYNTGGIDLKMGDKVIANKPIGLGLGEVIVEPTLVPKEKAHSFNVLDKKFDNDYVLANLSPATLDGSIDSEPRVPEQLDIILRKATEEDVKNQKENEVQAKKAHEACLNLIKTKKLSMKLVKTELSQNGKKAVFYFTSNNRVDFRDLVKDLLQSLKLRIELRQIDLRDETKIMGGLGCCGKTLCCSTFLRQFKPVSIKMAKEQNLALNPTKVSGVCGRLLCCLAYELDSYTEIKKSLPKIGNRHKTPDSEDKIVKVDIFSSKLSIILDSGEMVYFEASQVKELGVDRKGATSSQEASHVLDPSQPTASEAELKALEDPAQVVDIKDTFMKPARPDNRQGQFNRGHGQNDNRRPNNNYQGQNRPNNNNNRPPRNDKGGNNNSGNNNGGSGKN